MAARHMNSFIAILMTLVMTGFIVICSLDVANAQVDPSAGAETKKAEQAAANDSGSNAASSSKSKKTKKSTASNSGSGSTSASGGNSSNGNSSVSNASGGNGSGNDSDSGSNSDDEDVVDENAFSTSGNAWLGDVVSDSSTKDFYTIRTENDNVFYLVIDHVGNTENVYMLSEIDENDLQDFLEEGNNRGSVILPETKAAEETPAKTVETTERETKQNKLPGIISLVILIGAAIGGSIAFMRYRRRNAEPEDDYSEHMEDEGFPTVNEDEEFLE